MPSDAEISHLLAKQRDATRIFNEAIANHFESHKIAGVVVLFSGGNDSTVLAHLFRHRATHFGHCNTTIGVERTREFVRGVAQQWDIPLLEFEPDTGDRYEDLVVNHGFPGPGHHFKMYQRLKERSLRKMRRELVSNPRNERVLFVAGRRREESKRRMNIPENEREGSVVWCSPLANWSNDDMKLYREIYHPPHNEVTDLIHMSGECLCGAFAHPGEYQELQFWFPEITEYLDELKEKALANGVRHDRCEWGWAARVNADVPKSKAGPPCSTCDANFIGGEG